MKFLGGHRELLGVGKVNVRKEAEVVAAVRPTAARAVEGVVKRLAGHHQERHL